MQINYIFFFKIVLFFLVPIIYTNTLRHYTPYKPFISFRRSKKWV